eukprot:3400604-Pyramimonas_sp.AAC.1
MGAAAATTSAGSWAGPDRPGMLLLGEVQQRAGGTVHPGEPEPSIVLVQRFRHCAAAAPARSPLPSLMFGL